MFWPKIFFDGFTKALDGAVKPLPILQVLNILMGLFGLMWEYPLPILIPNTAIHRSIAARLAVYPISIILAALIYQGTNAAIYYLVGVIIYFWGYSEGEVSKRNPQLQTSLNFVTNSSFIDCLYAMESTSAKSRPCSSWKSIIDSHSDTSTIQFPQFSRQAISVQYWGLFAFSSIHNAYNSILLRRNGGESVTIFLP